MESTVTAFWAGKEIATGERETVARSIAAQLSEHDGAIMVFEDQTGRITDLDYRNTSSRGAGRPKLGVQAREVTLLPRHWDWLATQPGGASAALRRLVEAERAKGRSARERRDSAYRFMQAACGDMPGYEDALRALYAAEDQRLMSLIKGWGTDLRRYICRLLAFDAEPEVT